MTDRKTTLILGAGASMAYGYPLGSELRTSLLALRPHIGVGEKVFKQRIDELAEFQRAFSLSQMASIDAFLARRPEFSEIGKLAIAATLLNLEAKNPLSECAHADHWYFYLFNRIAASTSWEELDLSWLKVVTFNYDRSLEHYLISALRHSYGKPLEVVLERFSQLEIIHVYGSLGATKPGTQGYFEYGSALDGGKIFQASRSLRVIPEGRVEDETLIRARQAIFGADALAILGFGYDPVNLERLAAHETCGAAVGAASNRRNRHVAYTCMHMTVEEAKRVFFTFRGAFTHMTDKNYPENFYPMNCISTLRASQILLPPWKKPGGD